MIAECKLDKALDHALINEPSFTEWFLNQTKFANSGAKYLWSNSQHPWGRIPMDVVDPDTGETKTIKRDSETDVLVVFELPNKGRFALHIENKRADGKFEDLQPESYPIRAQHWRGKEKYQNYTDFETILVSPHAFHQRNTEEAKHFDRFISYEDIADKIPLFADSLDEV